MIRNYFKTAFRRLKKNKGFTAINVLGLSIGLATCLLILFYVCDELSFDRYNANADRIYRINEDIKFGTKTVSGATTAPSVAQALKSNLPGIEDAVRLKFAGGIKVTKGDNHLYESKAVYADASLFNVFTLRMIAGEPKTALAEPHTVVIDEAMAQKYFGTVQHVIGKTLVFNLQENYKVTGVIKDMPKQSHFNFDFFMSMSTLPESMNPSWLANSFTTYILLKKGVSQHEAESKITTLSKKYVGAQLQQAIHLSFDQFQSKGNYFSLLLMPLTDIHLKSNRDSELGANGSVQYVYIFSAIGLFILLIACVNFINLSTARSASRAREVGIRKVLGSKRLNLVIQFLSESFLITVVSIIIAVLTAWALLPLFNRLAGKELAITAQLLVWLLPVLSLFVVLISLLAGVYPAFLLSGFKPVTALKGKLATGSGGRGMRSFLVVFQFSISIFLIIGTLVIYNQLSYIRTKNIGYNRNQVFTIQNVAALMGNATVFKNEMKKIPGVIDATLTGYLPTESYRMSGTAYQTPVIDQRNAVSTEYWPVDEGYIPTLGMQLILGRNFSERMLTDSAAVIVNESAARQLGSNPIGKPIYRLADLRTQRMFKYTVIGVVKDFNFSSLRENITPVCLILSPNPGALSIRIHTANTTAVIGQLQRKWKSFSPGEQLDYSFMDQNFEASYRSEQRVGSISLTFTTLAIVIACLGLFGLAAYSAEQRNKEIGIRKVLGASVSAIVKMLSADFIKLVVISILIAAPLAWWAMHSWLQGFAYRQEIHWWVVVLAGLISTLIAFFTISFQSVKAAIGRPAESLRSE